MAPELFPSVPGAMSGMTNREAEDRVTEKVSTYCDADKCTGSKCSAVVQLHTSGVRHAAQFDVKSAATPLACKSNSCGVVAATALACKSTN
jgi:hypothetical protein